MPGYTKEHAKAGIQARLPVLETWPNQFPGYTIRTRFPEYTSMCPKTGLPLWNDYHRVRTPPGMSGTKGLKALPAGLPQFGDLL